MPAIEKFPREPDAPSAPFRRFFTIVPSGDDLPYITKGIRAGATGTITMQAADMAAPVVHPVLAGERIDGRILKVTACAPGDMVIIGYA
jgi:hypothetical protein